MITGASLGLPGTDHIFDDANIGRILRGEQFIDAIPTRLRRAMLDKHITRLVKSDNGGATFESIQSESEVIKLAARGNTFDLEKEFGVSAERVGALDRVTQLAIAAGLDALRDAGIPLVMRYKTTSKGTQLPDRWGLPDALRDETGVIFASAFPGYDSYTDEMARYYADHARREQLATLHDLRARIDTTGESTLTREIDRRIAGLQSTLEKDPYIFERRFLLKVLAMGHSQFAEFIGARGPNTQINSACASTSQAVGLAQDWISAGRCRRVVVISADDVTSDHMLEWFGAGFLATGAAATDDVIADAAIPFDRRRHGLIIGMGAAALVVESADAARERGINPICEVLSTVTANSAFHGTRLDVQHIGQVMEDLLAKAESRTGIDRHQIAPKTVFVSHETYTPARGGSASAEIHALRHVFGNAADQVVIANTKGFTGHAMATGIEDVVAVKALETGCVPPVANFKEVDPELGPLNLSKGGAYPVEYALHLGAGFGSQISMLLLHWVPTKDGVRPPQDALGYAYRISDANTWKSWVSQIAGHPVDTLEVVSRTLRVPDKKSAARIPQAVVWDAHIGGYPVCLLGIESRQLPRLGFAPADGPDHWTSGTLFPQSSKKIARAINAASNNRPVVLLAKLSGFDGSPESMRRLQLEYGAEIGRAIVNFKGPIVFCVISRFHGGAYVVFSKALNEQLEAAALEGTYASVIGGAPAAAVVFAGEVEARARKDPRLQPLKQALDQAEGAEKVRLRSQSDELFKVIHSEKLGEMASEFDRVHSVQRALEVGAVDYIIAPENLRPYLISAVERGIEKEIRRLEEEGLSSEASGPQEVVAA